MKSISICGLETYINVVFSNQVLYIVNSCDFSLIFRLRAIPPSYLTLPCQSLRCVVSRLMPPANTVSWTKNALVEMMSAVANKLILAKVVVCMVLNLLNQ
jgi:hypothetical protein